MNKKIVLQKLSRKLSLVCLCLLVTVFASACEDDSCAISDEMASNGYAEHFLRASNPSSSTSLSSMGITLLRVDLQPCDEATVDQQTDDKAQTLCEMADKAGLIKTPKGKVCHGAAARGACKGKIKPGIKEGICAQCLGGCS